MGKIDESDGRLHVELGTLKFNGSRVVFDKTKGTALIDQTNFFFKSKPVEIALSDIEAIYLVRTKGAAYPQIAMKSGKKYSLPSFSVGDAEKAVPRMVGFISRA